MKLSAFTLESTAAKASAFSSRLLTRRAELFECTLKLEQTKLRDGVPTWTKGSSDNNRFGVRDQVGRKEEKGFDDDR